MIKSAAIISSGFVYCNASVYMVKCLSVIFMNKTDMVMDILSAETVCPELKTAANNYLHSVGTDREKEFANYLIEEIQEDVLTNETVIKFFQSNYAIQHIGKDECDRLRIHHEKLIEQGIKYCDCDACIAGLRILDNKDLFL